MCHINMYGIVKLAMLSFILLNEALAEPEKAVSMLPEVFVTTSLPYLVSDAKAKKLNSLALSAERPKEARVMLNLITEQADSNYQLSIIELNRKVVMRCHVSDSSGRTVKRECFITSEFGARIESAFQSYSHLARLNRIDDELNKHQTFDIFTYVKASHGDWIGLGSGYPNSWSRRIVDVINMMIDCCVRGGIAEVQENGRRQISELCEIFKDQGQDEYQLRRNRDIYVFAVSDTKSITDFVEVLSGDEILRKIGSNRTDEK